MTSSTISPPDAPNLAKLVQAGLSAGSAPFTIKSEPQQIGDIAGGTSKTVNFVVKIDRNAPAGSYDLPLGLTYTYADWTDSESGTLIRTGYLKKTETINIPVKVTSDVNLEVVSASTEYLNVGTEGYLHLTLSNTAHEQATKAFGRWCETVPAP